MKQLWSLSGCSAALLMMTGVARLARDSRGWPGLETRRQRALAWERRAFYVSLCTSLAFSRIKVVFFFLKEKRLRLLQSLTRSRLLAQKKSARKPYPRGCSRAGHWSQAPIPATALPWVRGLGVSRPLALGAAGSRGAQVASRPRTVGLAGRPLARPEAEASELSSPLSAPPRVGPVATEPGACLGGSPAPGDRALGGCRDPHLQPRGGRSHGSGGSPSSGAPAPDGHLTSPSRPSPHPDADLNQCPQKTAYESDLLRHNLHTMDSTHLTAWRQASWTHRVPPSTPPSAPPPRPGSGPGRWLLSCLLPLSSHFSRKWI